MKLKINGEAKDVSESLNVSGLLELLGFGEKPVVVELNQQALFPREHSLTALSDGDVLEIIQITAGG